MIGNVDAQAVLAALAQGTLPPDLVYVQLDTPLGTAVIDPGASAADAATQRIMDALGVHVTVGFGPAPALAEGTAALGDNLATLGKVAMGGLALFLGLKVFGARA